MGSTRFPEKMVTRLGNYCLLEWVLLRTKQAKKIDRIVLATTTLVQDNILQEIAEKHGISVFRGSELDVVERFIKTSKHFRAENIIRICADNPLISPLEIDRLIDF